jgi:hypothetical protein
MDVVIVSIARSAHLEHTDMPLCVRGGAARCGRSERGRLAAI